MEQNNTLHIISEAVIVGGVSIFLYKKISQLETTVQELKQQIALQNNQITYLLARSPSNQDLTVRRPNQTPEGRAHPPTSPKSTIPDPQSGNKQREVDCNGGVCILKPGRNDLGGLNDIQAPLGAWQHSRPSTQLRSWSPSQPANESKKVVISKISKQIEFDSDTNTFDQTKVNTFTTFSPNPVLDSVTPKPSTIEDELDSILREIDHEN